MTIHNGLRQLGVTSYAKGKRHHFTNWTKDVFLNRNIKLLNWIKATGCVIKFFSDDKIFPVVRAFCRWSDHCIVSSSKEVHHTMTTKYPAGVMAICVVSSESNVLNRFFTEHKKFNATD